MCWRCGAQAWASFSCVHQSLIKIENLENDTLISTQVAVLRLAGDAGDATDAVLISSSKFQQFWDEWSSALHDEEPPRDNCYFPGLGRILSEVDNEAECVDVCLHACPDDTKCIHDKNFEVPQAANVAEIVDEIIL